MAMFEMFVPEEIEKQIDKVYNDTPKIFGAMTRAGAQTVLDELKATAPHPDIAANLKLTKVYETPSDGAINTKIFFGGYTKRTGISLGFVSNVFEYGRSSSPYPRKPFIRKAFNKRRIEQAMKAKQSEMTGGLLSE